MHPLFEIYLTGLGISLFYSGYLAATATNKTDPLPRIIGGLGFVPAFNIFIAGIGMFDMCIHLIVTVALIPSRIVNFFRK